MQEREHPTNPFAISTGFVEVDGGQVYYEVAGKGHPLILLQGSSFDRRIWNDQFPAFAQDYQVIRYDARGSGKSPNATGPYTQEDDLAHLFQSLKLERSYLLDLGGSIALNFMHKHAPSVDALLLTSPGMSPASSAAEAMAELPRILERFASVAEALQQHDMQRAVDEMMQHLLMPLPSSASSEGYQRVRTILADRLQSMFESMPPTIDVQAFDTRRQWLKQIHIPTLFLVGENAPPEIQASTAALEKSIPGVQIRKIVHARLLLNVEQPEEFNRTVLSFLHP